MKQIIIEKNITVNSNEIADKNRKLLEDNQIFSINLLGSPGSGKTCLLEKLIANIKNIIIWRLFKGIYILQRMQ